MNIPPEQLIFTPDAGLGPFKFGEYDPNFYKSLGATIGDEVQDEFDEICIEIEIPDLSLIVGVVDGLVDNILSYEDFHYQGENLVDMPIEKVKKIFSGYKWNTEPVWTPYDSGVNLLMHYVEDINLLIDEDEDGLVWSCMCSKLVEDDD